MSSHLRNLYELRDDYEVLERDMETIKQRVVEEAIKAHAAGVELSLIYDAAPMSDVWLRKKMREAGVQKAKPGPRK